MFWKSKEDNALGKAKKLLKYPNTIGYKIENDTLIVFVEKKVSEAVLTKDQIIPKMFEGYKTDVVEMEVPSALSITEHRRRRASMIGGISISPSTVVNTGTLGLVIPQTVTYELVSKNGESVYIISPWAYKFLSGIVNHYFDVKRNCEYYAITNHHVAGDVGTKMIQPGKVDSYQGLEIGETVRVSDMYKTNVDAALVKLYGLIHDNMKVVGNNEFLKGYSTDLPNVNQNVYKSGRTTGYTSGYVNNTKVSVLIRFSDTLAIPYHNVIEIRGHNGNFSDRGDSGSVVFDMNGYVIGLLFAGNGISTFVLPIRNVVNALKIEE